MNILLYFVSAATILIGVWFLCYLFYLYGYTDALREINSRAKGINND